MVIRGFRRLLRELNPEITQFGTTGSDIVRGGGSRACQYEESIDVLSDPTKVGQGFAESGQRVPR
jgi:hypothetical protein